MYKQPSKINVPNFLSQDSVVEVDIPLFQPFPSEVFFQQYETHQTYEFPVSFRNNDNVGWSYLCSICLYTLLCRWHDISK